MSNTRSEHVMNWRNRTKAKLVQYKGGRCQICGYDKPIYSCYDFHHKDANQKDFTISGKSWSFKRLLEEVDKCDLLCRNCHSEVHWNLSKTSREERQKKHQNTRTPRVTRIIQCEFCNQEFSTNVSGRKFCSPTCSQQGNSRASRRPPKEVLETEMKSMTWTGIGKKYGVTNTAVKKWARNYEIEFKTRVYKRAVGESNPPT